MEKVPDRKCMELAVREARKNFHRPEGGPFGACVVKDVMRPECLELFMAWSALPDRRTY